MPVVEWRVAQIVVPSVVLIAQLPLLYESCSLSHISVSDRIKATQQTNLWTYLGPPGIEVKQNPSQSSNHHNSLALDARQRKTADLSPAYKPLIFLAH